MNRSLTVLALSSAVALVVGFSSCAPVAHSACQLVPALGMASVYPVNGATAVPDSPGMIVFAQGVPQAVLSGNVRLVLTPGSGSPIYGTRGQVPSPLPTPNSSPSPGSTLVAFNVASLSPATTYTITFQGSATNTGGCGGPGTAPIIGGERFTTQ